MIFEVVFFIKVTTQLDILNGCNGRLGALDANALKTVCGGAPLLMDPAADIQRLNSAAKLGRPLE